MPHIILYDENGNEIGRVDHGPEGIAADDHPAQEIHLDLGKIAEGLGLKKKDKKKGE